MDKNSARRLGLAARKQLSEQVRSDKDKVIADLVVSRLEKGQCIGCYVSLPDEVNTDLILSYCFDKGIRVCVPKVTDNDLVFYAISSFDDLKEGYCGIREPVKGEQIDPEDIAIMIVPLSSFDDENNRTGYGRGFYDRILQKCGYKLGIAYREQKVDHIDTDPWDIRLDEVVYA